MQRSDAGLVASGELVETRALAAPVHTRRLRLRDGLPVVTDGPYAETQEVLAGYWIIERADYDRATEIASQLWWTGRGPGCPTGRRPGSPPACRSSGTCTRRQADRL